jgi:hypothetical protein
MANRIGPRLLGQIATFISGFITETVPEKLRPFLTIENYTTTSKIVFVVYFRLFSVERHHVIRLESVGKMLQIAAGPAYELKGKTFEEARVEVEAFLGPVITARTRWPLDYYDLNEPLQRIPDLEVEPGGRALRREDDLLTLKMRNVSRDMYLRIAAAIDKAVKEAPYTPPSVLLPKGLTRHDRDFEV